MEASEQVFLLNDKGLKGVRRMAQGCVGKREAPTLRTGEELGSAGSILAGSLGRRGVLLTMEGRFQRGDQDGWEEELLREFRRRKKVRENKRAQSGAGRELPFYGPQA